MRYVKILGFAAMLVLVACQPFDGSISNGNATVVSAPPATSGPAARTVVDERLLYAAEAAYNVPAHAYMAADSRGQLSPALKARVRPILVTAYARLQDARRLYNLGNAQGFRDAANAAIGLANSAKAMLPGATADTPVSP